jgi:hypothetical protein
MASAELKATPSTALRAGSFAKGAKGWDSLPRLSGERSSTSPCNIECNTDWRLDGFQKSLREEELCHAAPETQNDEV